MKHEVIPLNLYLTEGCWLCDWAVELLNGLKERCHIIVNTVEITKDDALYEKYRFDIPVIEFPDKSTLKGRVKKEELIRRLEGYSTGRGAFG